MNPDDELGDRDDIPDGSGYQSGDDTWVRELLADVRATDPVPPDVAARLDEALESLRAERSGAETSTAAVTGPSSVVPRWRRLGPALAAAAAVLVVAGLGVSQLGRDSGSEVTASDGAAPATLASPGTEARTGAPPESAPQAFAGKTDRVPALGRQTFARDATAFVRGLAADASTPAPTGRGGAADSGATVTGGTPSGATVGTAGCAGPAVPGAVSVPATLDGTPVALVLPPPSAGAQLVEAWSCDGATLLAAASVPR